ncbi:MAG: cytochrome c oxidase subunit II [Gammaproteobacteria bacterium]|nr:cytochrome c oxidase subunit II [Gammaproteobacteria bacterium]
MRSGLNRWMLLLAGVLMMPVSAMADWGALNMPLGVTEVSRQVYGLHMTIFYVCCVIGALVFAVMFYSMWKHRKSKGAVAADFHESTTVEIIWTIVPLVILIAMAIPAARVLIKMEDFSDSDMSIKVTAYQWRWQYEYLEEGISFYSQLNPEHNVARQMDSGMDIESIEHYLKDVDNELVVPVGKKIRFLHTAADVIHSWWVPDLAVKKDSIPGFINENWALIEEPGVYRGKCAELCGRDHGFMPIVVRALPQEEYDNWVAEQQSKTASLESEADRQWTQQELLAKGEGVYNANCLSCHQQEGQGIPGMFPAIAGSPVVTGDIDTHVATVLFGVAGTAMQSFGAQLSDVDIAAVITYQRNAFGNGLGDTLQPYQMKSLKDGLRQSSVVLPELLSKGVN